MEELELKKGWKWYKKSFNKHMPFFTYVDFKYHRDYVLDTIYKNELTIIDCSQDPNPVLDVKNDVLHLGLDDRIILLTSNYDDYSNYKNIFYFPYQLFRSRQLYVKLNINDKRKFKVSCLNRNPNTHKIYTFFKLQKLSVIDEMLVSFNNIIPFNDRPLLTMDHWMIQVMPANIKEELSKIKLYRQDIPNDDLWDWNNLINNNFHPAFKNSYLNIITETSYELVCLSEKTFKPLISGQLFTFSSAPYSLEAIKKLGFETFDDILNPNYDSILNMYDRIDNMIDLINNVYQNIEQMYFENKEKIKFNQEHFQSIELEKKLITPLVELGVIL